MDTKDDFKNIIQKAREERTEDRFEGTFLDYVLLLEKDPSIAQIAHARMYNIITQKGVHKAGKPNGDKVKKRRVFLDENVKIFPFFEKDFFGMEKAISKIVRFSTPHL